MTFTGELFPFQQESAKRMLDRRTFLLALQMGLGKTVITIAAVEELIDTGAVESCLVICPASIKWQWKRSIDKFSDGALVRVIAGSKPERRALYRAVKRGEVEYVIMNYEQIVNDWDIVRLLDFDAIVLDEAQAIKSPSAKRSRCIKRLKAPYRFALTGQPIENRPEEAFSIMEWVDRTVLGRADVFDRLFIERKAYGQVARYKHLRLFRERMEPVMDRKTRDDVADQMPAVVESVELVELDQAARRLYRRVSKELLAEIYATPHFDTFNLVDHYSGVDDAAQGQIMSRLMALRMLCDSPELLSLSASAFDDPTSKAGSQYAAELKQLGLLRDLKAAPKVTAILDLIEEILEADPANKVVLFSFFKPMLHLLSRRLKWRHVVFTGELSPSQRDEAIQTFHTDKACRVFLSSDAGGVGVDLPAANYLISADLPWSAGKFEQRKARIDRISSKWPEITLISVLVRGSIEERMLDLLETKSAVAAAWLDGRGLDKAGRFEVTLGTLADFLASTAV